MVDRKPSIPHTKASGLLFIPVHPTQTLLVPHRSPLARDGNPGFNYSCLRIGNSILKVVSSGQATVGRLPL